MSALFDLDTFEPTTGMARTSDPETSHGAAVISIGNAHTNRRRALLALYTAGDAGLSDFELADATGVQQTSIGKRRGELRDAGLVRRASDATGGVLTRPSPSNSPAIVWCLTAAGMIAAETVDAS